MNTAATKFKLGHIHLRDIENRVANGANERLNRIKLLVGGAPEILRYTDSICDDGYVTGVDATSRLASSLMAFEYRFLLMIFGK